jgi:anti-anti-sigma factor
MKQQSEMLAGCEVAWSPGLITMSGVIDMANASAIERHMRGLIHSGDLVVDCRSITFLDVAGSRLLAEVGVMAIAAGATVCLQCSQVVTEMLNLCGVREIPGVVLKHENHDRPGSRR